MDPVFLAAFGVDTDFHRDSSTDTVFSTAVQGENAAQTAFRPRTAATTYTPEHVEGAKIGEPPASLTLTRPERTDNTQTSARRIAHHAAIATVHVSADLTTAVQTYADVLSVCGSVVAWPPGRAGNASGLIFLSSPHQRPLNPGPAPLSRAG